MSGDPKRNPDLITAVLERPQDGRRANLLLNALYSGLPVSSLTPLLANSSDEVVQTGAWLLSEIGYRAKPLLPEASRLLCHQSAIVRYLVIDCILVCASEKDFEIAINVVQLLDDSHKGVRKRAMFCFAQMDKSVLLTIFEHAALTSLTSKQIAGLNLIAEADKLGSDALNARLLSQDPLDRRFAVIAAARMRQVWPSPLSLAMSIDDEDVSEFARQMHMMKPTRTHVRPHDAR